jgi:lysophospholipase L1-like esterase
MRKPLSAARFALRVVVAVALSSPTQPIAAAHMTGPSHRAAPARGPVASLVISRGVPAFTNDDCSGAYPATRANDADYGTQWRSCAATPSASRPVWLAYDLSSVPAVNRGKVLVVWYNDPTTSPYDHTLINNVGYNIPASYSLEGNPAPGGQAPVAGWVQLVSVSGNTYHSRQHLVDLTGFNWVRMNVSASDGSTQNFDVSLNLDVHDASAGLYDDWIFFGDSITQDGMNHDPLKAAGGAGSFAQLIQASNPDHFPAVEDGGIGGLRATDGATHLGAWLQSFAGRYVALSYGTNDANSPGGGDPASAQAFYDTYATMINLVLASGRVPIVPTIPWARTANVMANGPVLNQQIQALYTRFPQVVRGPDLWSYFQSNQSLISADNLHPAPAGYVALRGQWAAAMTAAVYQAPCTSTAGPGIAPPASVPSGLDGFHAAWFGQSGYQSLCAGARWTAVVAYYNTGSRGWVLGRLGEVAYLGTWDPTPGQDQPSVIGGDGTNGSPNTGWPRFNRVAVQPAGYVGPGQVAWFQFTVQAPNTPGRYSLAIRPLIEGAQWMEDYGVFWYVTVLNPDGTPPR